MRQQGLDVGGGPGYRRFCKDPPQLGVRLEALGLGGLDQALEPGRGHDAARRIGELELAPGAVAQGAVWADGVVVFDS